MSEREEFQGAPDCDVANCPHARIVWKDGQRFVEHNGSYRPFASFVEVVLLEMLKDLDEIKAHIGVGRSGYNGLVP